MRQYQTKDRDNDGWLVGCKKLICRFIYYRGCNSCCLCNPSPPFPTLPLIKSLWPICRILKKMSDCIRNSKYMYDMKFFKKHKSSTSSASSSSFPRLHILNTDINHN